MLRKSRAYMAYFFAIAILAIWLFCIGAAISGYFDDRDVGSMVEMMVCCTLPLFVPGIVLIFLGRKWQKDDKKVLRAATIMRTYKDIHAKQVAAKMGVPIEEAEELMAQAIDSGLVDGVIDPRTGGFERE